MKELESCLTDAENFECPQCGIDFSEEDLVELCNEPFNGTILECDGCGVKFDTTLKIRLMRI